MLGEKRFIQKIKLRNLLSYGPDSKEIELKSLNVLIGPNGSGKSNLLEALNILRNTPKDTTKPILQGGGIQEYIWKGSKETSAAEINAILAGNSGSNDYLRHVLCFTETAHRFKVEYESIVDTCISTINDDNGTTITEYEDGPDYYCNDHGEISIMIGLNAPVKAQKQRLTDKDIDPKKSVLSQRRDPVLYSAITYLANQYSAIKIYSDWNFGRISAPRESQSKQLSSDFLEDGNSGVVANNLALVVNELQNQNDCWQLVMEKFRAFHPLANHITTNIIDNDNKVELILHEKDLREPIPAIRWSDGMLHYLALLTILCHPDPPPLVCIEEPELGLHPDILPGIAELLIEASHRMQLIVTTHSDVLVSALTQVPESILVCEREQGGTVLRRLEKEKLAEWLEKYSLDELWQMGELGGNPW